MKKELVFAIALGGLVGVILTFGMWTANRAVEQRTKKNIPTVTPIGSANSPTPNPDESAKKAQLLVTSPENQIMVNEEALTVTGRTFPKAILVILQNDAEYVLNTDEQGNFSYQLTLAPGSNSITFVATDAQGNQVRDDRVVVYSTADLEKTLPTATPKPTPTPTPVPKKK